MRDGSGTAVLHGRDLQAGGVLLQLFEVGGAAVSEELIGERGDGDCDLLQALFAAVRRYDDFFQLIGQGCRRRQGGQGQQGTTGNGVTLQRGHRDYTSVSVMTA